MSLNLILFIVIPFLASAFATWILENLWHRKLQERESSQEDTSEGEQVDCALGARAQRAQARREEFIGHGVDDIVDFQPTMPMPHQPDAVARRTVRKPRQSAPASDPGDLSDFVVPDNFSLGEFSGRQAD